MKRIRYTEKGPDYSQIIAGTMRWGKWGQGFTISEYQEMIAHCLSQGITSFDHADIYGAYTTEAEFGEALDGMGVDRSSIQIISKCGIGYPSENRPAFTVKHYNVTSDYIRDAVTKSLQNLRSEYLDMLLIHRPSALMDYQAMARTFEQLVNEGTVKEIGVSNFTKDQFDALHRLFPLATNQLEISVLETAYLDSHFVGTAFSEGIRFQSWSPLGGTTLFNPELQNDIDRKNRLTKVAQRMDMSLSDLALRFVLSTPFEISPVIGTSKKHRITESINCLANPLTSQEWFDVWTEAKGHKVA